MIYSHESPTYIERWQRARQNRYNGAYYYSREICENIIPNVQTARGWVTINDPPDSCEDHAIVFIHNNLYPNLYDWLADYKDLVLVCGVPSTCEKVAHLGTPVYLPLSVDVAYVERFKAAEHDKGTCYVGRKVKRLQYDLGRNIDTLEDMPREKLLERLARYENAYAVGRCAIECKILDVNVLPFDERYPNPGVWKIIDNKHAAKILQKILDSIDRR